MKHTSYFRFVCCIGASLLASAVVSGCSLILDGGNALREEGDRRNAYNCACDFESNDAKALDPPPAVNNSADDAMEVNGVVSAVGPEELSMESGALVAVRFPSLGIPRNATVKSARVQFTAAARDTDQAVIKIAAENSAAAQSLDTGLLSTRSLTSARDWTPPSWDRNETGSDTETPDLAAEVNEVIGREDWSENSALVLIFETLAGQRVAKSLEGALADGMGEPVLFVTYADVVTANLDVCLNGSIPGGDDRLETELADDCSGRVQRTVTGLAEAVGYFAPGEATIACRAPEGETGRLTLVCDEPCIEVQYDGENFSPTEADQCINDAVETCAANGTPPAECTGVQACLLLIGATNAAGDEPVCLAEGPADESSPTQYALASQLFGQRSVCSVQGMTEIEVEGEEPKEQPFTEGTLEILGGPCPNETCRVGFSSELKSDDIQFDIRFAPDPVFQGLAQTAVTYPGVVQVGGDALGSVAERSAEAVSRGRRKSTRTAFVANNTSTTTPLELGVNWSAKTCTLEGDLAATVDAESQEGVCDGTQNPDDPDQEVGCILDSECTCESCAGSCILPEDLAPLRALAALSGVLVNQPPSANAGGSQSIECTSADGADFQLDCGGSFDPDGNDIRFFKWRAGNRFGPVLANEASTTAGLRVGESGTFYCLVIDSFAQSDEDTTTVDVVDTTPPEISCNTPELGTIDPVDAADDKAGPKEQPRESVSFTATATDVCDATVTPVIESFDCVRVQNGREIDKTESCVVALANDTVTILDTGGVGTHITWRVTAADDSGNTSEVECSVEVVRP